MKMRGLNLTDNWVGHTKSLWLKHCSIPISCTLCYLVLSCTKALVWKPIPFYWKQIQDMDKARLMAARYFLIGFLNKLQKHFLITKITVNKNKNDNLLDSSVLLFVAVFLGTQ